MTYRSTIYCGRGCLLSQSTQIDDEEREFPFEVTSFKAVASVFSGPSGGWLGPDPSDDNKIQIRHWATNAPEWRQAAQGLSLEGHCQNGSCRAYMQDYVLVKWGYRNGGIFDFFRNDRDVNCPICGRHVQVENFGFYHTRYKVIGSKKETPDGYFQDVNTDWKFASADHYTTFLDDPKSLVHWGQLRIEVQRP